jgi:hypothetical protein
MTNNLKSGLLFASAVAVTLTASPTSAGIVNRASKGVKTATNTVKDVANNVSNSQTDKVAKAVGYANFAAAQAKGYADTEILEFSYAEAIANN